MTRSDLIVLAPWIIFGAGLAAVCLRLWRPRHLRRDRTGGVAGRHDRGGPG
jgi:hypothetical protein